MVYESSFLFLLLKLPLSKQLIMIEDLDPPLSSTLIRPPNSLFAHQKVGGQIRGHEVVGK